MWKWRAHTWTRPGNKVIFSSDGDLVAGSNTDRTDMVQLTNTVNPAGIVSVAPHWTPDTNTIVVRGDGVI